MNVSAFLDAFEQAVITPLESTRDLFDAASTVTRLYTTLSPEEMTVDPEFDVNDDLDDVSNVHTADRVMHCDGSWTITLPQGHTIESSGTDWPIRANDDAVPYNARTLQLSARGDGEVVIDNYDTISSVLIDLGVGSVDPENPVARERGTVQPPNERKSSSGCATWLPESNGRVGWGALALALGLLSVFRRRRV
jgi:hypothetical protein